MDQQRRSLEELAAKEGYVIVDWYADAGKSGSKDLKKRTEFLRMLKEAETEKFQGIIAYDNSRFLRLNSLNAAPIKNKLLGLNIFLHTVREGKTDWSSFLGRVLDTILCEFNAEYSRSLSKLSCEVDPIL